MKKFLITLLVLPFFAFGAVQVTKQYCDSNRDKAVSNAVDSVQESLPVLVGPAVDEYMTGKGIPTVTTNTVNYFFTNNTTFVTNYYHETFNTNYTETIVTNTVNTHTNYYETLNITNTITREYFYTNNYTTSYTTNITKLVSQTNVYVRVTNETNLYYDVTYKDTIGSKIQSTNGVVLCSIDSANRMYMEVLKEIKDIGFTYFPTDTVYHTVTKQNVTAFTTNIVAIGDDQSYLRNYTKIEKAADPNHLYAITNQRYGGINGVELIGTLEIILEPSPWGTWKYMHMGMKILKGFTSISGTTTNYITNLSTPKIGDHVYFKKWSTMYPENWPINFIDIERYGWESEQLTCVEQNYSFPGLPAMYKCDHNGRITGTTDIYGISMVKYGLTSNGTVTNYTTTTSVIPTWDDMQRFVHWRYSEELITNEQFQAIFYTNFYHVVDEGVWKVGVLEQSASNYANQAWSSKQDAATSASTATSKASSATSSAASAQQSANAAYNAGEQAISNINDRIAWFDQYSGKYVTNIIITVTTNLYIPERYPYTYTSPSGTKYNNLTVMQPSDANGYIKALTSSSYGTTGYRIGWSTSQYWDLYPSYTDDDNGGLRIHFVLHASKSISRSSGKICVPQFAYWQSGYFYFKVREFNSTSPYAATGNWCTWRVSYANFPITVSWGSSAAGTSMSRHAYNGWANETMYIKSIERATGPVYYGSRVSQPYEQFLDYMVNGPK